MSLNRYKLMVGRQCQHCLPTITDCCTPRGTRSCRC